MFGLRDKEKSNDAERRDGIQSKTNSKYCIMLYIIYIHTHTRAPRANVCETFERLFICCSNNPALLSFSFYAYNHTFTRYTTVHTVYMWTSIL